MRTLFWIIIFIIAYVKGAPTTVGPLSTTGSPTTSYVTSATINIPTITEKTISKTESPPTLLKRATNGFQQPYQLRGRAILANTRAEGSDEWGLDAEQAEVACDRIAQQQGRSTEVSVFDTLMRRLSGKPDWRTDNGKEGHLLSIGSPSQVVALGELLWPLPRGAYWTGGKLIRHNLPTNSQRNRYQITLTWSDGRIGSPNVLGMTKEDESKLEEDMVYCLALDLYSRTWQARDCSDRLPYACLITPRHVKFSNEALGTTTESPMEIVTETTALPFETSESSNLISTTSSLAVEAPTPEVTTTSRETETTEMNTVTTTNVTEMNESTENPVTETSEIGVTAEAETNTSVTENE